MKELKRGKRSPIICLSIVEEGETKLSDNISKVAAEVQDIELSPLRGSSRSRKRTSGSRNDDTSTSNRAVKEARVSADVSIGGKLDASTQTYRPSDRLTKLYDAETRLFNLDAEISHIKCILAELSAE